MIDSADILKAKVLVVDDQDAGLQDVRLGNRHAGALCVDFKAVSSVAMKRSTLIGLVR